jgi:hypothetical protein
VATRKALKGQTLTLRRTAGELKASLCVFDLMMTGLELPSGMSQ